MPKIAYQKINLRADSLALIETCNRIIDEYLAAGFVLTVSGTASLQSRAYALLWLSSAD